MPTLGFLRVMISIVNVALVLLMGMSPAGASGDPCGADGRLAGLANSSGVLALCAACDIVPGADSVCSAVFKDEWWKTFDPPNLAEQTSRESLASGLDWVCSVVRALPPDSQYVVLQALESYVVVASALELMGDVVSAEAVGTAIAFVPVVADLFPRDEKTRVALGRNVGESLASAEFAEMQYNVAKRLSHMSWGETAECLRALWIEALKQQEE